jgi:RNA polymerase sigma factor (sigma-70 family)
MEQVMNEPLDNLLERLTSGDVAAAEQVFLAYEPYLRKAVRRNLPDHLRAKFDSTDVVQSVWADVLRSFRKAGCRFLDADHLRGFLFIATRNRLIDRIRQHRDAVEREEPIGPEDGPQSLSCPQPRPSEVAQAGDLWEQILARCPAEHRSLVELRRQGYSLAEIAERTGLHADSVRRILRTLAREMAFKEAPTDAERRPSSC